MLFKQEKIPPMPMPIIKQSKKKSSECDICEHFKVCKFKRKFKEQKEMLYPQICECEFFKDKLFSFRGIMSTD